MTLEQECADRWSAVSRSQGFDPLSYTAPWRFRWTSFRASDLSGKATFSKN